MKNFTCVNKALQYSMTMRSGANEIRVKSSKTCLIFRRRLLQYTSARTPNCSVVQYGMCSVVVVIQTGSVNGVKEVRTRPED